MSYKIVKTTTDNKETAEKITNSLLQANLSPCVQIFDSCKSHYIWKEKIVKENEFIIEIKTNSNIMNQVLKTILKHHLINLP